MSKSKSKSRKQAVRILRKVLVYECEGQAENINAAIFRLILSDGTTSYLLWMVYMRPLQMPDGRVVAPHVDRDYRTLEEAKAALDEGVEFLRGYVALLVADPDLVMNKASVH